MSVTMHTDPTRANLALQGSSNKIAFCLRYPTLAINSSHLSEESWDSFLRQDTHVEILVGTRKEIAEFILGEL
jgi:hypothetical protein